MELTNHKCPVLVLGIGNILLRDEGVGVRVIEALREMPLPEHVELCDGGTAGADLLDILSDRRKVIVIDAMDTDAEPGTVYRLTLDELRPADTPPVSLHDIGLLETLDMARYLGTQPDGVVVFGVKPANVDCGLELSPAVRQAIPRIIDLILQEISG